MADRSEAFISDNQARDAVTDGELAMDEKGRFLALRVRHLANVGGFLASTGAHLATNNFAQCFPAMYRIPHIDVSVRCVFTNTLPLGPYRGAGRPEANYVLERLVDEAARVIGKDRASAAAAQSHSALGDTLQDRGGHKIRQRRFSKRCSTRRWRRATMPASTNAGAKAQGAARWRGIGISCFLEHSGGSPTEGALIAFPGGNSLTLGLHVQSTGQGHASVFRGWWRRSSASRRTGAPSPRRHQSRHQGRAVGRLALGDDGGQRQPARGRRPCSARDARWPPSPSDVAEDRDLLPDGYFEVAGTNHRLSLFDAAARAKEMAARGEIAETLDTHATADTPPTYPNGCHIAEVEVDPEPAR